MGDFDLAVPSPTFTLIQSYTRSSDTLPSEIWHVDLYRLNHEEECIEIGLLEAMQTNICLIEWPERLGTYLPPNRIDIHITMNADGRCVIITQKGEPS
jgi:tRNA threonylcarbamoyl adenosine modification protein YjeE